MRRVLRAKASARIRKFVPNQAQVNARPTGRPLAGTSDPRLNKALVMLCNLQVGGTGRTAAGR